MLECVTNAYDGVGTNYKKKQLYGLIYKGKTVHCKQLQVAKAFGLSTLNINTYSFLIQNIPLANSKFWNKLAFARFIMVVNHQFLPPFFYLEVFHNTPPPSL